jgi:hypothetical protein
VKISWPFSYTKLLFNVAFEESIFKKVFLIHIIRDILLRLDFEQDEGA